MSVCRKSHLRQARDLYDLKCSGSRPILQLASEVIRRERGGCGRHDDSPAKYTLDQWTTGYE